MTETGAEALLVAVSRQAAQDLRSRTGVSTAACLDAYEYLRHIGLDREHRQTLLQQAREAQERRRRTAVQRDRRL